MRRNSAVFMTLCLLTACREEGGRPGGFSGGQPTDPPEATGSSSGSSSGGTESGTTQSMPADQTTSTGTTMKPEPGQTTTGDPPEPPDVTSEATTEPVETTDVQTTTGVDPSTTGDDTTTTDGDISGDPPDPPMNDPQPVNGVLYADCSGVNNCNELCLELQDEKLVKIDGFCSTECADVNDCLPAPKGTTAECLDAGGVSYCLLPCVTEADCPQGMSCELIDLGGSYCW